MSTKRPRPKGLGSSAPSAAETLRERIRASLARSERRITLKALGDDLPRGIEQHFARIAAEQSNFLDAPEFAAVIGMLIDSTDAVRRGASIIRLLVWIAGHRILMLQHSPDEATQKRRSKAKGDPFELKLPGFRVGTNVPTHTPHLWASWISSRDVRNGGGSTGNAGNQWRSILVCKLAAALPKPDEYALIARLLRATGDCDITPAHVRSIIVSRGEARKRKNRSATQSNARVIRPLGD